MPFGDVHTWSRVPNTEQRPFLKLMAKFVGYLSYAPLERKVPEKLHFTGPLQGISDECQFAKAKCCSSRLWLCTGQTEKGEFRRYAVG